MSTTIRPEISPKNCYWIDKHRYYELKHFCLQYPLWKHKYNSLIVYPSSWPSQIRSSKTNVVRDPVSNNIDDRLFYEHRISMLERVAKDTDKQLGGYVLKAITEGVSYEQLKARLNIPCCKDTYYDLYRRFFWLLSKERK